MLRGEKNFGAFYRKVNHLAKMDKTARTHALRMTDVGVAPATFMVQRTNGAMP